MTSSEDSPRDRRFPKEGSIHVHRDDPEMRVEVLRTIEPRFTMGSVMYRRVGGTRRIKLNVSRFFSLYRPEETANV